MIFDNGISQTDDIITIEVTEYPNHMSIKFNNNHKKFKIISNHMKTIDTCIHCNVKQPKYRYSKNETLC